MPFPARRSELSIGEFGAVGFDWPIGKWRGGLTSADGKACGAVASPSDVSAGH
jgi:hypothetical protein